MKKVYSYYYGGIRWLLLKLGVELSVVLMFFLLFWLVYGWMTAAIYNNFGSAVRGLLGTPLMFFGGFVACFSYALLFLLLRHFPRMRFTFWLVYIGLVLAWIIQCTALGYTRRYVNKSAWMHLEQFHHIFGWLQVVMLLGGLGLGALLFYPIYRVWWEEKPEFSWGVWKQRFTMSIVVFGSTLFLAGPQLSFIAKKRRRHAINPRAAEFALAETMYRLFQQDQENRNFKLSPKEFRQLRKYGLFYNPKKRYSLVKNWVFKKKLPYPRNPDTTKKPNILIIFAESLSAPLLNTYGAPYPGLTPHLTDFARSSMVVRKYYNHTTPTINGLRGQLCSIYPLYGHKFWKRQRKKKGVLVRKFHCLPNILKARGYDTYYFSHDLNTYINLSPQMKAFGITHRYFQKAILKHYLPGEKRPNKQGLSDQQMMRVLIKHLKRNEAKKKQPWLLTLSTINTHHNYYVPKGGVNYNGWKKRYRVNNVIHNFDNAFGKFWRYFQKSPYAKNTIVVVTGDHTMFPTKPHMRVRSRRFRGFYFDKMALMLYDPTHKLPREYSVPSSSADLTPTLLHLLDWNLPNAFMGVSLFERRLLKAPWVLGVEPGDGLVYQVKRGKETLHTRYHRRVRGCLKKPKKGRPWSERCRLFRWYRYHRIMVNYDWIWSGKKVAKAKKQGKVKVALP